MENLFIIIIASFIVSLISFSGAILLIINERKINKYLLLFVALAAGALLASAFLDLIPKSFELFYQLSSTNHIFFKSGFIYFTWSIIILYYRKISTLASSS